ncbi:MAG TPA: hypothetical protein VMV94_10290 [Phycisphaerae bacterium]|nr:hypothetical protein [Phycisphaerae bacterium]
MLLMSIVTLTLWWSSPPAGSVWFDGPDMPAGALQDEPPPPGPAADQEAKHPSRQQPANDQGRGQRRWDRARHERWREFREGRDSTPPPEMVDLAMSVLQEKVPDYYQEMTVLRAKDKAKFEWAIGRIMPMVIEYAELRDRDQKLADTIIEEFKIEHELRKLSHDYKAAEGSADKQAACVEQIQKLVRQQFELRAQRQEARLKDFAERLKQQQQELERERERFERRQTEMDDQIAKRVEEVKAGKMGERFHPHGPRHAGPGESGGPPRGFHGQGPGSAEHEGQPPADRPHGDHDGPRPPDQDKERGAQPPPPPDTEAEPQE